MNQIDTVKENISHENLYLMVECGESADTKLDGLGNYSSELNWLCTFLNREHLILENKELKRTIAALTNR